MILNIGHWCGRGKIKLTDFGTYAAVSVVTNGESDDSNGCNIEGNTARHAAQVEKFSKEGLTLDNDRSMEHIVIRQTTKEDLPEVMAVIGMAVRFMKSHGIRQWNDGYPNEGMILEDIRRGESYVCLCDGKIVGTAALSLREETTYRKIYDGEWLTDSDYGVIHRIAVDDTYKGRGIAGRFVDYIEKMCISSGIFSVRVDTHADNGPMQKMLLNRGFYKCGYILLASGDPRVAFEKILNV